MTALETAVEMMDAVHVAVQNGEMQRHSDLRDLHAHWRGEVLAAYFKEDMEDFIECAGQIGRDKQNEIIELIFNGQKGQAREALLAAMADTPLAQNILQDLSERAEAFIHDREASNRLEETRLQGAVVYYMK